MHLFSDGEKIYMCVKYKAQLEFICDVNGWLGDWLMEYMHVVNGTLVFL